MKYLKNGFIFDILSCLPLLIYERYCRLTFAGPVRLVDHIINDRYYFYVGCLSFLRFSKTYEIFVSINVVCNKAQEIYYTQRISIENAKNITFKVFLSCLMVHILTCMMIVIRYDDRKQSNSNYLKAFQEKINSNLISDSRKAEIIAALL